MPLWCRYIWLVHTSTTKVNWLEKQRKWERARQSIQNEHSLHGEGTPATTLFRQDRLATKRLRISSRWRGLHLLLTRLWTDHGLINTVLWQNMDKHFHSTRLIPPSLSPTRNHSRQLYDCTRSCLLSPASKIMTSVPFRRPSIVGIICFAHFTSMPKKNNSSSRKRFRLSFSRK